jgi:hypothetical protein
LGTVPTPPTQSAGAVITAANLNTLRDCINFLEAPPRCRADHTTTITLTTSTYTLIPLQTETFDIVQGGDSPSHDNTTNNSRIVFRTAGKYRVTGQLRFAANATGTRIARIRLNAAGVAANGTSVIDSVQTNTGAANAAAVPVPPIEIAVNASDYIEMFGWQDSGGNLNTFATNAGDSFLQAEWVGL